jgi:hypothetical protein
MGVTNMTAAKTIKTLRKAFADFEAAYVGVEAICRESDVITSKRANAMLGAMLSVHIGLRQMLGEAERKAKGTEESA